MKSVLISIKPKWCELIANGKKTVEVRKTRPKCDTPFKCYIYCTNDYRNWATKSNNCEFWVGKPLNNISKGRYFCNGKVIGEFICNKIDRLAVCGYDNRNTELRRVDDNLTAYDLDYDYLNKCQLSLCELKNYANGSELFGWRISDLVIYDKPKELSDFSNGSSRLSFSKTKDGFPWKYSGITRPPQSWCYVEEVKE